IEQPALTLLSQMGWETRNCYTETFGENGSLGRETPHEVVLAARLLPILKRFNPQTPQAALELALEELCRDRSVSSAGEANRQVSKLLKEGVPVSYRASDGSETFERIKLIDWENPNQNDFFCASQLWISGEIYKRRADLVCFVNGIPLVFIELKAAQASIKDAFTKNLRDYKNTIPHLFWYNAFIILSNGSQSRIGSLTADWDHFNEWKKINREGEEGVISLETVLRGTCQKERLVDLVENFTLHQEAKGGLRKIIAQNHQYLGVNNALQATQDIRHNKGKLGVFWHTQGSGKSFSMIFFSNKVLRKLTGNWTFIVITDRKELDQQIYKNFADCGAVTEAEVNVRASSGEHLQQLLQEDHRFVFTLIQKFHIEHGKTYPKLSNRSDIIVITDEAHRSQYDVLALNMRNALPNAAFIAFTGTPLMVGEERTRQVFGDYVSIYNFKQSADDQATVPLYYENRIPELQLTNPDLNRDMENLLEEVELDDAQEQRLEREFSREYHLITRDERLEKVAEDIVLHFAQRGYKGKAMVISIDKCTAVKMYDKVRKYWNKHLSELMGEDENQHNKENWQEIQARIAYMRETDMAVVVSQGQNEVEDLLAKGVDILPHRKRMIKEDLAEKFKDAHDPFRMVFVCAMWMTGFDAPSCATIYLDKPMRNHTLMQTIARANRVFQDKVNGLIVDYIGVFRNLQKALAIYGTGGDGGAAGGEMPVQDKHALVEALQRVIGETKTFLAALRVDLAAIQEKDGFQRIRLMDDAVSEILVNDETKRKYLLLSLEVEKYFQAILPDPAANQYGEDRKTIVVLAEKIRCLTPPADISNVMEAVAKILDESVAPKDQGYVIQSAAGGEIGDSGSAAASHWVNLSQIDFEALKKKLERNRKRIVIEKLRGVLQQKISQMVAINRSRMDFHNQYQSMIAEYNAGVKNSDAFFAELLSFAQSLNDEDRRNIRENLSDEELTIFDLLTKPDIRLTKPERDEVKRVARELLYSLKTEQLVLDWRNHQRTRAGVQLTIEKALDFLPESYGVELYQNKCDAVFQHVYDSYYGAGKSVY
ncbi:MAG: type I restriction endonuclease subunit R, partial [Chloroflexota bacterium]